MCATQALQCSWNHSDHASVGQQPYPLEAGALPKSHTRLCLHTRPTLCIAKQPSMCCLCFFSNSTDATICCISSPRTSLAQVAVTVEFAGTDWNDTPTRSWCGKHRHPTTARTVDRGVFSDGHGNFGRVVSADGYHLGAAKSSTQNYSDHQQRLMMDSFMRHDVGYLVPVSVVVVSRCARRRS